MRDTMKLGTLLVDLSNFMNHASFHFAQMIVSVLAWVKVWGFPFEMHIEGSVQEPSMSKNYSVEKTAKNDAIVAKKQKPSMSP